MNFLHYEFDTLSGDTIRVMLDKQANVRLLDNQNFAKYKNRQRHESYGGLAKRSPISLVPPRAGHWHVVIDLGGYSGRVSASAQKISRIVKAT